MTGVGGRVKAKETWREKQGPGDKTSSVFLQRNQDTVGAAMRVTLQKLYVGKIVHGVKMDCFPVSRWYIGER